MEHINDSGDANNDNFAATTTTTVTASAASLPPAASVVITPSPEIPSVNGNAFSTPAMDSSSRPEPAELASAASTISSVVEADGDQPPLNPARKPYSQRSRNDLSAIQKEREERVRRVKEEQEEERRRKLEELKQHATAAQKFREQQENERRRHVEEMRLRDSDKRSQVEERKRAIEEAERERRMALLKKNKEREERLENKRRNQQSQINYAFGSSTPRMIQPRVDSMSDIWGARSRSTSSSNVFAQMSQSMYSNRRSVDQDQSNSDPNKKRATSAHGLNRNSEGEDLMSQSFAVGCRPPATAHRRRTDLVPTLPSSSRADHPGSRSTTPGRSPGMMTSSMSRLDFLARPRKVHAINNTTSSPSSYPPSSSRSSRLRLKKGPSKSQSMSHLNKDHTKRSSGGLSRESTAHSSRPPSVMSTDSHASMGTGVRMRNAPSRRPRPFSIATTGIMSSSMYEKQSNGTPVHNSRISSAKSLTRDMLKKRARSVTSDKDEDVKSTTSNSSSLMSKSVTRKTPAQVKAESAARKAKHQQTPKTPTTPSRSPIGRKNSGTPSSRSKSPSLTGSQKSLDDRSGSKTPTNKESPVKDETEATAPTPPQQQQQVDIINSAAETQPTSVPDVISSPKEERTAAVEEDTDNAQHRDNASKAVSSTGKPIITNEEEAKARLAAKRREMKEKKEREAELERQRQLEIKRQEEERRRLEEEEERRVMEEAERLAEEARKTEELRLAKAIEEAQKKKEEERRRHEEEERIKKEKELAEIRKQEELAEKLRKEEEERMRRKKRIEEIMARTRGGSVAKTPTSTPTKKPGETGENPSCKSNENKNVGGPNTSTSATASAETTPATTTGKTDDNGSDNLTNHSSKSLSKKPDLLGDIVDNNNFISEENAKNNKKIVESTPPVTAETGSPVEKGVIDVQLSEIQPESTVKAAANNIVKKAEEVKGDSQSDLEQIVDSSIEPGTSEKLPQTPPVIPIIAFEEKSITVPKQERPTADLLS